MSIGVNLTLRGSCYIVWPDFETSLGLDTIYLKPTSFRTICEDSAVF